MAYDAKEHWENIYQIKNSEEVSWHQDKPITSLKLISELSLDKDFRIIDVGAGDSKLVDNLLNLGFKNITALDISLNALEKSKKRLGNMADDIKWVVSDLRKFETEKSFDEAVVSVLKSVEQKGWSLFQIYDVKERLAAKGFKQEPLKIIEICSGKYANQFLNKNRLISLCMPCKINVLDENGKVKIVGMKPTMISQFFSEVDRKEAEQVEKDVIEMVDNAR